jgi:TetR/AcrR family transcriptional regulator, transcriptional repressor of bet genes
MSRSIKLTPTIEARRRDLIKGTIKSISEHGYADSTVQSICDAAGLSRGLIGHYFDGKEDLLLQAFCSLTKRLDDEVRLAMAKVGKDPFRRLLTVSIITFNEPKVRWKDAPVWLAFWGVARWNPEMLEVHRTLYRRFRRWIERLIATAAADRDLKIDARRAAITFTQLIDGLWLGWVMEEEFHLDEAQGVLLHWLCETFRENPADHEDLHEIVAQVPRCDD